MADLSDDDRGIMAHAVAWDHPRTRRTRRRKFWRNHYATQEGCDGWDTIQKLCDRGLMRAMRGPTDWLGGMSVFAVTEAGIDELRRAGG